MMTATSTRQKSRESLSGKWGKGALIILAFVAFSFIITLIESFLQFNPVVGLIVKILMFLVNLAVSFGLTISFIRLKRSENVGAFDFANNIVDNAKRGFGITIHTLLKMIIPILLFIVAMFLTSYSLLTSVSGIIGYSTSSNSSPLIGVIATILYLISMIWLVVKGMLYSLSYYIAYDHPEMTTKEAVNESARLMKGNRGNLFVLDLSFIGWAILATFTLGIGMFWLIPYMQVAQVCFYEEVSQKEQ